MKMSLLPKLRCPRTGQPLLLHGDEMGVEIGEGCLVSADGRHRYPIRAGIPRFVPDQNYADSFGLQWNRFRLTQLDSHSGHAISAERFWRSTGWKATDMAGRWVLDIGCGSGRFAEIALAAGAHVIAMDYSSAVDAAYLNLGHLRNFHVVQGDIYALPFAPGSFSFVYSLGVLQHTPDVRRAFMALPAMLQPGGRICVDFYSKSWKSALLPKYWLRPLTKRMNKKRLYRMLERAVPWLLALSTSLGRVPLAGRLLKRVVPVANYVDSLPLTREQHLEWSLLDTFDWLSPEHDHPQTARSVRKWLTDADLVEREVFKDGHLIGRARRQ